MVGKLTQDNAERMLRIEPPPLGELRDEGPDDGERPEEVGVHLQADLVEIAVEEVRTRRRTGVVDQQRDVAGDVRRGRH
jgi:hypothetical protein